MWQSCLWRSVNTGRVGHIPSALMGQNYVGLDSVGGTTVLVGIGVVVGVLVVSAAAAAVTADLGEQVVKLNPRAAIVGPAQFERKVPSM
jgi:hypothetical protein